MIYKHISLRESYKVFTNNFNEYVYRNLKKLYPVDGVSEYSLFSFTLTIAQMAHKKILQYPKSIKMDAQQTLMEMVVSSLHPADRAVFQSPNGQFLPISQWTGLIFDDDGSITEIHWFKTFKNGGQLEYHSLPSTLVKLTASCCTLHGQINLKHLPRSLTWVDISGNHLSCDLQLRNLPPNVELFRIENNQFEGPLDLVNLQSNITHIFLANNSFEGPLDLRNLPSNLVWLDLSHNSFSDEIQIGKLPDSLGYIDLSGNKFDPHQVLERCGDPTASIFTNNRGEFLQVGSRKTAVCLKEEIKKKIPLSLEQLARSR